jgi:hypothetical protein
MRFRSWMEQDAGLGAATPEMMTNRGSDTPASDAVKRTGLQPQVDAQEIETKQKKDQDRLLAIDAAIQRVDKDFPQGKEDSPKINKFRKLWEKLKEKWDEIKVADDEAREPGDNGLAQTSPHSNFMTAMQQSPNMAPTQPQFPAGPGSFGMS